MAPAHCLRSAPLSLLPLTLFSIAVLGTTGCNMNQGSTEPSPSTPTAHLIQGSVYGGQQPIVGATIQLYAAGTPDSGGGYGEGATALLTKSVTTSSNGSFTITGDYNLPSSPSYFYIVATGGSPGNVDPTHPNTNIVMMAAISGCTATSTLSSSLFININEVTTAAAVMELQPFIAAPTGSAGAPVLIGAPAANYNDLRTAFENVSNLAGISTGTVVSPTGSKGQLINTLADILASCVNSDPYKAPQACSNLFLYATPAGDTTAGDTTQAAWYIAQNPTNSVSALFGLISPTPPFVALSSSPASFAVSVPTDLVACFAVLGGSTIANTGSTVVSGGDIGLYPGTSVTGFPPGALTTPATQYVDDSVAENAQNDLAAAYVYAAGLPKTNSLTGQDLGSLLAPLTPGVYNFAGPAQLSGSVTLDAQGNPNAVFIFQIGSTLTTASSAQVLLINSAQAQNVFWQVGSSATLGSGTDFKGTIMASVSITVNSGTSIQGRVLANTAAVTLDGNTVTVP